MRRVGIAIRQTMNLELDGLQVASSLRITPSSRNIQGFVLGLLLCCSNRRLGSEDTVLPMHVHTESSAMGVRTIRGMNVQARGWIGGWVRGVMRGRMGDGTLEGGEGCRLVAMRGKSFAEGGWLVAVRGSSSFWQGRLEGGCRWEWFIISQEGEWTVAGDVLHEARSRAAWRCS
ncbi:hypothetical protein F5146DRAFT_224061 [Armillaria mellea]|nr:hypothetical protein F5146DRAFT_224061 [Armillaria mellea]